MSSSNIAPVVDEFGALKAEIARLEKRAEKLRAQLIECGTGVHEGEKYHVSVTLDERVMLPIKAARKKLIELGVSRRWFDEHETRRETFYVKPTQLGRRRRTTASDTNNILTFP
jgi:hypothetical protein